VPATAELAAEHAEHTARLAAEGVDFLLLETWTVKEIEEALVLQRNGKEFCELPLCNRRPAVQRRAARGGCRCGLRHAPAALSVNCVSPKFIESPLEAIARISNLPLRLRQRRLPNVELTDTDFTRDVGEDQYAAGPARGCAARGCGGCCGTTPDDVRAVAHASRDALPPGGRGLMTRTSTQKSSTRTARGRAPSIVVSENENLQSKFVVQKVLSARRGVR